MGSQQQQSTAVICNTDAAWDKERKRAGLAWTFSGTSPPIAMEETLVQEFVGCGSLGGESGSIKGSGPRDPRSESLHRLHNAPWSNQRHIAEKRDYWCCLRHQIDLYCFRLYLPFSCFKIGQLCLWSTSEGVPSISCNEPGLKPIGPSLIFNIIYSDMKKKNLQNKG